MSHVSDSLIPTSNSSSVTPLTRSDSLKHTSNKRGVITKEKLFAHSLYADDIDFIRDQNSYMREAGAQSIPQSLPEDTFIAPTSIAGYKILDQLSPKNATSYIFKGLHEITGESVFIKLSPDFAHVEHAARFLNDWYITSGLNPASEEMLWTIGDVESPSKTSPSPSWKTLAAGSPVTLPKDLPGILYPIKEFNVEEETLGVVRKSMALVYPDLSLKSMYDYYSEKIREILPEKTSLWSGSIISGFSDHSTASLERSSSIHGSENGDYVELANKVKQLSKPSSLVVEILRDIIDALKTLSFAHKAGICHNGITSHSILVSTLRLKEHTSGLNVFVIGWDFNFSVAIESSSELYRKKTINTIQDMFHYMPPEGVNGGMTSVDYRSDIYSIGVVLYELIVGCLPFRSDNLATLQRIIMDQNPIQPKILGPKWISNDLNYVVLKCLRKNPSERYSSIDRLIDDLKLVVKSYCEPIRKENGKLAFKDIVAPTTEQIPLFHSSITNSNNSDPRKAAFEILNNSETSKVIVLQGDAGVGKATLMEQISGLAQSKGNFIVNWRYHFEDNNVSKHASSMFALHSITRQILSSSEEVINEWRKTFTTEIEVDLSILFSAIPSLKTLLGTHYKALQQTKDDSLSFAHNSGPSTPGGLGDLFTDGVQSQHPSMEEESRDAGFEEQKLNIELKYSFIFKKFFTLVARKGLTVLLENLHLCTQDEYDMLREFLQFSSQLPDSKLFLVASFENEAATTEFAEKNAIFPQFQATTESLLLPFHILKVERLSFVKFDRFLEKFTSNPNDAAITRRIYDHVDGKLLSLNYLTRLFRLKHLGTNSFWGCLDLEIQSGKAPTEIGLIISEYLNIALTPKALRLLKYAAVTCVNGYFSMSDLMIVTGISLKEVNEILLFCMKTRLIVPTGICYKVPFHLIASDDFVFEIEDSLVWDLATRARYKFDHDVIRIHLIREMGKCNELMEVHRECGLQMKRKLSKEVTVNITSYLLMVSHIYRSCDVARAEDFRHYNEALITGGRYAISTSNLPLALRYFTSTMRFVHKDDKRRKLKIIMTQVQCNYLLKNFDESIRLIQQVEVNIGKENLSLAHLKVCSLFNMKKYEDGMRLAIISLQRLKIDVSNDVVELRKIAAKSYTQLPLSVSEIRDLKSLKAATNKLFLLVTSFIMDMINPTYILDLPDVRIAILSQLVQLMHRYGRSSSCAIPLLHLANVFLQPGEHMSTVKAQELTDVALDTINENKGASTALTQSINESYLTLMGQFRSPVPKILKAASLINQEHDPKTVNYFIDNWMLANLMFLGNLRGYVSSGFSSKKSVSFSNDIEILIFKSIAELWCLEEPIEEYLTQVYSASKGLKPDIEFVALANAVIKASSEQNFQLACALIMDKAFDLLRKTPVSILHIWFYFISVVCLTNCNTSENKKERLELAKEIESYFKIWSTTCYVNFGSEMKLIEACIKTQDSNASELTLLDLFEEAIDDAQRQQNWLAVAMANRLCAKWLQRVSKSQKRANEYAHRAFALYSAMNAPSQILAIKKDFPDISDNFNWAGIRKMVSPEKPIIENANFFEGSSYPNNRQGSNLRIDPSIKSIEKKNSNEPTNSEWTEAIRLCLTISQSSSLDLIVQTLLESALMFSGVDYGAVILNFQTKEPTIKAIGTNNSIFLLDDEQLATRTDLVPFKLVLQCLLTGEITCKERKLLLHEDDMNEDIYYSNNPSYSGICIPISTSTVIGVIYLESHFHSGSPKLQFPLVESTKIDLLYLLCSQAAVSFSKSVVYTQMELAKKAAEEATEEKASFLANMSHEIRTPFNSLFACSIFLLDTELDDIQKEYVETIKDSALVTLNIIDGILAFTKIEHGSFTLETEDFSINDTIESAILFSSEQTESDELEFAYFNRCPQIETIQGDPTRIRQIIINLVGNALKFTSKGYVKVILDAKLITDARYEVSITVEDTGIGIPEDSRSKVFGAFAQVDGSSRRVYGGSGLGLAISNKLAEIMNGRITFTSEEGIGSVFCFTCPFEVALNDKTSKVEPRDVCIVSNTRWKRLALRDILEYYGATIALYDSINDLIRELREFEILIIDKNMILNDIKIRSSLNWKRSLIYVLTRFGLMLSDQRLKEIEADSLIFSPIKRKSVRKLLENNFNWKSLPDKVVKTLQKPISSGPDVAKSVLRGKSEVEAENANPLTILIAEDNPVNLRVALQHLKKLGYIADHAKDGVEVLEKCEEKLKKGEKYDVIFMDIQMPRKDGIQATQDLRKSYLERGHAKFLPQIIALTANVAGEERSKCLHCGMIDFVTKPILPAKLKSALQKVIGIMRENND
ncbi:hypothetical protein METBIDRAFT_35287 [Metschnikowia bicuspidata var. bicuspidata NRRL YB-4993]|uniref:histidine kinase n=1 Tax=Metschnikowia bicuspidata var. bicuspidata NRRL YB-4993 TaxID=869754 RepID=A0A1A0HI39_9ASCO|nr:hypothetical protein METBIDRAFT_35287 [Metschnikowia bicuspidata var. bicuspidata NRRL YB-4993]OBA23670.1 hypothetical protein METBIDRAFT_35287 [Metschnikowia bicuspidata var. bicuspidata NRRL YB-4993]